MILVLARRTLLGRPVRSAVLAAGFGLGVAVMAALLGIGEVILDQARSPALVGGGDVLITSATGSVTSARFVLSSALQAPPLAGRTRAASPTSRATLYLLRQGRRIPVRARGGIPSLERALDDRETAGIANWTDNAADEAWARPTTESVLRAMDRFHPIPEPTRDASWAEWLYFNGQRGGTRFYLTFLVGPRRPAGMRGAGVRLQLDEDGRRTSFVASGEVDEATLLRTAPDLSIAGNTIRLEGARYELTLDLVPEGRALPRAGPPAGRLTGRITLEAVPGRSLPPLWIRGANQWVSGYTVPVMAGAIEGALQTGGRTITLERGTGYHDHNWGFWQGVSWRWGQVQYGGRSFVYGRVFPPADAADPDRVPSFLAAMGPEGPIGYATEVTFEEPPSGSLSNTTIVVRGRGPSLDLTLHLRVEDEVVTPMGTALFGAGLDFVQLRARYRVQGTVGDEALDFEAPGSAETFRGHAAAGR